MANIEKSDDERREFPRLQAPVYCRPVGMGIFSGKRAPVDISLGGLRIYSDEYIKKGTRMKLEVFLRDNTSVSCKAEAVWIEELPPGSSAVYDVGFKFTEMFPDDIRRLSTVLDEGTDSPGEE